MFCVTILAGILEIREFAKFIVGDKCVVLSAVVPEVMVRRLLRLSVSVAEFASVVAGQTTSRDRASWGQETVSGEWNQPATILVRNRRAGGCQRMSSAAGWFALDPEQSSQSLRVLRSTAKRQGQSI